MVREIYSLRETLTKNFEVNSTNVMESNGRTKERTDEHQGENYIPRVINAGGIMKTSNYSISYVLQQNARCIILKRRAIDIEFSLKALFLEYRCHGNNALNLLGFSL